MALILTILLFYIVMGYIGGLIGQRKGRVAAGVIWSLLFGPIGWIVVFLGPDMGSVRFSTCPHCAGKVSVGSPECPHCKNRVLWMKDKAIKPARSAE